MRPLRTIRDFVDRCLTTKTVIAVTILVLLASWIYPPWILGSYRNVSHGWFFVFDTTRETVMRVDFGRLFLIDGIILAAGGLLAWAVLRDSASRHVTIRLAFYALFVLPFIAVICLAALVIGNLQREADKRAGRLKQFDWATGTLVEEPKTSSLYDAIVTYLVRQRPLTVEVPGRGLVEFPAGMSSKEIAAVIKKKFPKRPAVAFLNEESTPPPPSDKAALEATPQPQFVTTTQSVSIAISYGTIQLPPGTRLEFVSKEGSDVRILYEGREYTIPISTTDLK